MAAAAVNAMSPNTLRSYRLHWSKSQDWTKARGLLELPARPQDQAAFLAGLAEAGASLSAVKLARWPTPTAHRERDLPDPSTTAVVTRTVANLELSSNQAPHRITGLTREGLAASGTPPAPHGSIPADAWSHQNTPGRGDSWTSP